MAVSLRYATYPNIHSWDSLTPAELKVVALVAEGLTNKQIAGALFISRFTVETHLKHVFAKLGLSSRAALAAHTVRHAMQRAEYRIENT